MFVWVFHRISGVLLIFLLALQIVSGFSKASPSMVEWIKTVGSLHEHALLNCLTVFLLIFHALYGLRTILMDLGLKAEKRLFWGFSILGAVLCVVFLVLFLTLVAS